MTPKIPKALQWSEAWFARLLVVYPRQHRAEYGPAMLQLFRDQGRQAWREAHGRGLLLLWIQVLPDLLKTSFLEHLANLKGKKLMTNKLFASLRPQSPSKAFWTVFLLTFGFVLTTAILMTFILPESYRSSARIKINDPSTPAGRYDTYIKQIEFEVIQSPVILDKVIEQLGLNERWKRKYGAAFTALDSRAQLQRMLELRPSRNTSLVNITVCSDDKREAAEIANSIAENYKAYMRRINSHAGNGNGLVVELIEHAEPGLRPVRPNKPLNIFIGIVSGSVLGLLAGGIAILVVLMMRSRGPSQPKPMPPAT